MTDMRAVGFTEFGDPSVLGIVTVPRPAPGPGQVLVRVAAATVNPTDLGFRRGGRALPPGMEPPFIPGMDLAGVIDAVGPEVAQWHPGNRVMAAVSPLVTGGGAQAEGLFQEELAPLQVVRSIVDKKTGEIIGREEHLCDKDECNRADTTIEGLSALTWSALTPRSSRFRPRRRT